LRPLSSEQPGDYGCQGDVPFERELALADAMSVDHFENIASRKCPAI